MMNLLRSSRKTSWLRVGVITLVSLAFVLVVGCVAYRGWLQVPSAGLQSVTITSTDRAVLARELHEAGMIPSMWSFRAYLWLDGRSDRLKTGGYELSAGLPYRDLVGELIKGVPKTEVSVRVIEGRTLTDIQQELATDFGIDPTITRASMGASVNEAPFAKAWREEFSFLQSLPENRSLEGYLFPNTYRVWKEQLPESLIRKQLQEFQRQVVGLPLTEKSRPLTSLDEVIRLASIVEKEVPNQADRRIVAGIFLTRLREGMLLQTDASVQYITSSGRARSTAKDLQIDSPFNTYKYKGLPPAPIAQPSLSAIQAVLDPDVRGYRYFLTDKQGKVFYARTFQEHIQNRAKAGY